MLRNHAYLRSFPKVFRALTGLDVSEFADLIHDILPRWEKAERKRLSRCDRKRDIGGEPHFELTVIEQLLLTVIWLRHYLIQKVLGFLFGLSGTTTGRYINRLLPLLEQSGRDTMRRSGTCVAGGGLPHNNMQPYLALNFCIAMQGVFPARN